MQLRKTLGRDVIAAAHCGLTAILLATSSAATANASGTSPLVPPPANPLTVRVITEDADHLAALLTKQSGPIGEDLIQEAYFDKGSYGLRSVMMARIGDAKRMAAALARSPDRYDRAVRECLPIVKQSTADLRSIYLALAGLFPGKPLPQVYVVFGVGNSGGTAGLGAQVIGLEVLCSTSKDAASLCAALRKLYAHETVHALQTDLSQKQFEANPFLRRYSWRERQTSSHRLSQESK